MTYAVGEKVHVYTGRGWRTGVVEATGPGMVWVVYGAGKAMRRVRVSSEPRFVKPAKERRPRGAPAATRVQLSLDL